MYPSLRKKVSIAAGAVVDVFANELIARLPVNSYVQVGIAGGDGLIMDLTLGGQQVAVGNAVRVKAAYPEFPREFDQTDFECYAGQLNRCAVRNPTAGSLDCYVEVRSGNRPLASMAQ